MPIRIDNQVTNALNVPIMLSNNYINRPTPGIFGRLFISIDTYQIYQDRVSGWSLIADAGAGSGNLESITQNGNTTTVGIYVIGSGTLSVQSLTNGSVLFPSGGSGQISQDNTNFFWDNTNKYLGLGTNTPTAPFDIHSALNVMQQLNSTGTNNSFLAFLNQDIGKWRIGNYYNSGNNDLIIYDTTNTIYRAFFTNTGYAIFNSSVIIGSTNRSSSYGLDVYSSAYFRGSVYNLNYLQGSVLFAGAGGLINQNNSNFFWDNTNNRLGINQSTPLYSFDVTGTGNFSSGALTLTLGADNGLTTRTNATQKIAKIVSYNYTNANNPVGMMIANNDGTDNALWIGGGSGATIAATNIQFYTAANNNTATGTPRMTITSGGDALIGGTTNTYSYRAMVEFATANILSLKRTSVREYGLQISSGGSFTIVDHNASVDRFLITSGGNVNIGTSGTNTIIRLLVQGVDATSSNYSAYFQDSSSNALFYVRNDGLILTGSRASSPYNNTSGNVANMVVGSDGTLYRSTVSSLRFKENIKDWDGNGLNTILALKPKTFTYKESYYKHTNKVMLGLIAEEVAEISTYLADFQNEDGSGQVENVRYATIVIPLIKAIQELNEKLIRNNIN